MLNKKNIIKKLVAILVIYILGRIMLEQEIIPPHIGSIIFIIGINIILAVSLNLINGFTGQFSLGHAGFMALGAYASGMVTAVYGKHFIVGILFAAVLAAVAGLIIGIPTLRLKGDYLAIATLGFAEIIRVVIENYEKVGGAAGLNDIPIDTTWTWLYFVVVITLILINNFIKSYQGRACIAIREDEIAAEAMGVNTTYYKVLAFVIGAAFAGIAGALYAGNIGYISPDNFKFMKSIDILVMVVFGGIGSISGAVAGATILAIISYLLQDFSEYRMILYALILMIMMLYRPQGILGQNGLKSIRNWFKKLLKKEERADASANS
ncbi:MAG: branched-chain amino acid ABC transporter permease [Clostridia bacterium]|jgi:branched-chain amino acid transport system permease protein|nr:branched-chain amino acid ABC transporter permease [Clostridia bacterium]